MKQVEIKTGKATILVVDLPESGCKVESGEDGYFNYRGKINPYWICVKIPKGNYMPIGSITELTEEDWKGIVRKVTLGYWMDYTKPNCRHDYMCDTATESGLSLLKANGVVLENEFGDRPVIPSTMPETMLARGYGSNDFVDKLYDEYQWQEAESKVWKNAHIFIKQ